MTKHRTCPTRTCVGCRQRAQQHSLLRVCVADGRIVADPRRVKPGRGAYVHYRRECLESGLRRGGIARGLRRGVRPDDESLLIAVLEGAIGTESEGQR